MTNDPGTHTPLWNIGKGVVVVLAAAALIVLIVYRQTSDDTDSATDVAGAEDTTANANTYVEELTPDEVLAGLDDDIPLYEGATLQTTLENTKQNSAILSFLTDDPFEDVVAYYQGAMSDEGWTAGTRSDTEDFSSAIFTKDTRQVSVLISASEKTTLVLSLEPAQATESAE